MYSHEQKPAGDQAKIAAYEKRELLGHKKRVLTLGWSSSGRKLASGSTDTTIRVWPVEPHSQVSRPERADAELKGHSGVVSHLAWKPSSESVLASTASDKSVRLWDAKSNKNTAVVSLGTTNLNVTWSPDCNNLAAISNENTLSIIDVRKAKVVKTHKFSQEIYDIHWGPTLQHLMLATDNGSVDVVSMPSMEPIWSLRGHTSTTYCFATTSKYKYMVTGGGDSLVALWDLDDMVCTRTWAHMDGPVRSVSLSYDGQYVAYSSEQGEVEMLSARTGERMADIKIKSQCDAIAWSPTHNVLAYCDEGPGEVPRDYRGRDPIPPVGVIGILAPPKGYA